MATIYATLADQGVRHEPVFVSRIVDATGKTVYRAKTAGTPAVSPQVANTVTDMLTGVISQPGATGTAANIGRPAAGKTGTNDENKDAWFDGYTPQLVAVVWMGRPDGELPMGPVGRYGEIFGGTYPAQIWQAFMSAALQGQPVLGFTPPDPSQWPAPQTITIAGRPSPLSPPTSPPVAPQLTPPTTFAPPTTTAPPTSSSSSTSTSSTSTSSTTAPPHP